MKIKEHYHFYKGNRIPKLEHSLPENKNLLLVSLAWGLKDPIESFHQNISDYYIAAKDDNEATAPFSKFLQYPSNLNNLQVAVNLENENLLREYNKEEYTIGIESFVAYREGTEFGWTCFGGPSLLLKKKNQALRVLHTNTNWASDRDQNTAILPKKLLGIHPKVDLSMDYVHLEESDKVFLYYSSSINPLQLSQEIDSIESFVHSTKNRNKEHSFWLAEILF